MSKVITIYGKSGSGKSTLAVNLACCLARQEKIVILISANLNHGTLQIFFNEVIPPEKGILAALEDRTEHPQNMLLPIGKHSNIYLLDVPNQSKELYMEQMDPSKIENMIRRLKLFSDVILVDATASMNDPFTIMSLHLADQLIFTYTPSAVSCLWHRANQNFFRIFSPVHPVLTVVSQFQMGCSLQEFYDAIKLKSAIELPFVRNAVELENMGSPIYWDNSKEAKRYKKAMEQITDALEAEENEKE